MADKEMKIVVNERQEENTKVIVHEPIPTLFIDGFQGVGMVNGVIRLNLYEEKFDPITQEVTRYIVTRLCMPMDSFLSFADVLSGIKASLAGINKAEVK